MTDDAAAAVLPAGDNTAADAELLGSVAARILRDEINHRHTPQIPEGSIVRFSVDGYRYAALSVGDRWYTTAAVSHHLGSTVFESTADFIERALARADSIEVATGFTPV